MATKIERIENPDGTVTLKGTRYKRASDDPSSSAYRRKKKREEKRRRRRLMGHDGGPKPGDVRNAQDAATAKRTERRRRMRLLAGDPEGTSTAEGERRAQRLLNESPDKDKFKAWVEGASDERPDLRDEEYRSDDAEDGRKLGGPPNEGRQEQPPTENTGDGNGITGTPQSQGPLDAEERVRLLEKLFEKEDGGTTKPFFRSLNPDGTVTAHFTHGMTTLEELQQKAGAKEWLENELGMTVEARAAIIAHRESLREQGYTSKQIEAMDDARQRRLGGQDGGPQPGDIWTKADLDRALKTRESEV